MTSADSKMRSGFTLLELSIVLVIIGLLVGGIAGFRTYTANASRTTMMNEGKYYTNAFNQFTTRYNNPPGDYATASAAWSAAAGHDGDGNGIINNGSAERYYAFQHLSLAGFIQGTYTGAASGGNAVAGVNVPGSAVGTSAFIFDHPAAADGVVSADATYFDGTYGNVLIIAGLPDTGAATVTGVLLTPKQALQLDEKFDDGTPGQGNIVTPKSTALANCATTDVTTTAVYNLTYGEKSCYFIIKIQ